MPETTGTTPSTLDPLRLDALRCAKAKTRSVDVVVVLQHIEYRTLTFYRPLGRRHLQKIITRWGQPLWARSSVSPMTCGARPLLGLRVLGIGLHSIL